MRFTGWKTPNLLDISRGTDTSVIAADRRQATGSNADWISEEIIKIKALQNKLTGSRQLTKPNTVKFFFTTHSAQILERHITKPKSNQLFVVVFLCVSLSYVLCFMNVDVVNFPLVRLLFVSLADLWSVWLPALFTGLAFFRLTFIFGFIYFLWVKFDTTYIKVPWSAETSPLRLRIKVESWIFVGLLLLLFVSVSWGFFLLSFCSSSTLVLQHSAVMSWFYLVSTAIGWTCGTSWRSWWGGTTRLLFWSLMPHHQSTTTTAAMPPSSTSWYSRWRQVPTEYQFDFTCVCLWATVLLDWHFE